LGCTQEEAQQAPGGAMLPAWGGAAQAPRGCFVCPRPAPNAIMGPVLPSPRLALGHAWQCPSQSATWRLDCSAGEACQAPRGAWAAALRREPKRHAPNMVFFIVIAFFFKFINDDNNIYTLINFNKNNNIYNTNNNIFSTNNMNYYKNNIIYNTKYNNILEMNTINYTKK
jgi:hypothetical protein